MSTLGVRGLGPSTLRGRMVTSSMLLAAVVTAALVALTQVLLAHANGADARRLAHSRAAGVAATVQVHGGRISAAEGDNDTLDRFAWVYDTRGRLLDGRLPRHLAADVHRLVARGREGSLDTGTELLYARPVRASGGRVVGMVVATVDEEPYEAAERRALLAALGLGAAAVALAGVGAAFAGRRVLASVHWMASTADAWQEHEPDRRFALGPPRDELGELARTLDHMLARIAGVLADERRLTDEVAHELRTPVTVIRSEAQLARGQATGEVAESLEAIVAATDRLEESLRTILAAARGRDLGDGRCDAAAVAAAALEPLAGGPALAVRGEGHAALPADALRALLAPLLSNAVRHARTRVEVRIRPGDPDRLELVVLDDGAGFTAESAARATEAGWSTEADGTGLGLAVATRLAASAGSRLRLVPADHGEVVLDVPAATTSAW